MEESGQRISKLMQGLPRFHDGRVDFTNAPTSPLLNIVPYYDGKILLLRRSSHVKRHKGLWSAISAYVDQADIGLDELAYAKLHEAAGILEKHVKQLHFATAYELYDYQHEKRNWLILPVLAELSKRPSVSLHWEHNDFVWIRPEQLTEYPRPSRLHMGIERALSLLE
jgi:hypothetical protein